MITVRVMKREKFYDYIETTFPDKEFTMSATVSDIANTFKDVDKDTWFVINYCGEVSEIKEHLALLTYKIFMKAYVEIVVSEGGTLIDLAEVLQQIMDASACEDPKIDVATRVDKSLSLGEVSFTLLVPKYSITDTWGSEK